MARRDAPELVPLLSAGKHRNPRKGACFMEYASVLAGENWSDHPDCTHPLLAGVARGVNDRTSDQGRSRLVPLIPSVIGLKSDDLQLHARIAIRCALTALPLVAEPRQRALAVGMIVAERSLERLDPEYAKTDPTGLFDDAAAAMSATPRAARWANEFVDSVNVSLRRYRSRSAPNVVRLAIVGISEAAIPDPDRVLYELLSAVIRDFEAWVDPEPAPVGPTSGSVEIKA